jgi:tryptophanyl-tRNA synthetase
MTRRVFSGIQPTGTLHIGNYFGAIRNWAALQNDFACIYCIVDYHAITNPCTEDVDPRALRLSTLAMALDLMACGIDPDRSILFVQSDVPTHTELAWILACVTSYGDLTRMTQFKEKSASQTNPSAGLFSYPVLQAADILLYLADGVPVGEDQVQHLELSRRIARRFNGRFGEFFPEPEPIVGRGARIMSLADPTIKMSKSEGEKHYVGVFEDEASIRKKVRSAVTDVGLQPGAETSPGVANLFEILELSCELSGEAQTVNELRSQFEAGTLMYSDLKDRVYDLLIDVLRPIQTRRRALEASGEVVDVLAAGAKRAEAIASKTIAEVRRRVGLGTVS